MSVSDITDANEAREDGTGRKEYVNSLEKGLMVLKVLANASKGMTLSEVALACGTSRASARRFLLTLDELGFVEQIDKRFELTPKVLTLGGQRFDSGLLWQTAKPLMQALSDELNDSCSAALRDGDEVVYVARVAASRIMSVSPGTPRSAAPFRASPKRPSRRRRRIPMAAPACKKTSPGILTIAASGFFSWSSIRSTT